MQASDSEFLLTVFVFAIVILLLFSLFLYLIHSYKEIEKTKKMIEEAEYWRNIQNAFSPLNYRKDETDDENKD